MSSKRAVLLLLAMLLGCHAGLLAWSASRHSPTFNEPSHLASGISHWQLGSYSWYSVNPPCVRMVAALPVLPLDPKINLNRILDPPSSRPEHPAGVDLLVDNGARSLQWVILARWACIPFSLLGASVCFLWASQLFDKSAGLLAATMWCFSPYILGHAAVIAPDAHAAAAAVTACYLFWCWLQRPTWYHVIAAGVILGLAELTKFTLLVLYPLFFLIWLVYRAPLPGRSQPVTWRREFGMMFVLAGISLGVINLAYNFECSFQRLGDFRFCSTTLSGTAPDGRSEGGNRFSGSWLGLLPVPLPKSYAQGLDVQKRDFETGLNSYLRGESAAHGWWYYYLYALAIKEPLGTWCLVLLAIAATISGSAYSASWRDGMVVLMPLFTVLALVSSQTGFSTHSRYVIPALPFLFVWTSKVAGVLRRPWTRPRWVMAASLVLAASWSVGSSLSIYPHSLSYFNELAATLPTPVDTSFPQPDWEGDQAGRDRCRTARHFRIAGPRHGPRHLLNSNIDWSQDLFYLKEWLERHPQVELAGLNCFGCCPPSLAGIPKTPLPPPGPRDHDGPQEASEAQAAVGPRPGWYVLSVNRLYGRDRQYRYFRGFHPVAMAGYSIYIYHITLDDANRVRRKLGLPALAPDVDEMLQES